MQRFAVSLLLFSFLAVATVSPVLGQVTQVPDSLKVRVPQLFPSNETLETAAPGAAACGEPLTGGTATTSVFTWTEEGQPSNHSYYPLASIAATFAFTGADGTYATTGFTVSATMEFGDGVVLNATSKPYDADLDGTPAGSYNPTFALPTGIVSAATPGSNLTLKITLTPEAAAPALGAVQSVSIECGPETSIDAFDIGLGQVGDGDNDFDGQPDSEDLDDDNDGASDAAERAVACTVDGHDIDFSTIAAREPGDHDADGASDEEECEAGYDPTTEASTPPGPEPFPWAQLFFLSVLVLLVLLFLYWFFSFGRVVDVTVLSTAELIVPKGGQGKYEVEVRNRRGRGNPINFQLSTSGLPDGWDAKLSADHAVLDPKGAVKESERVWLTVEAPEHEDPESAVVAVRAVPLNTAGRKDTFKRGAKARVITSINVPPNAKVPVKRGGPVKLKSEKEVADEAAAAAAAPPPEPEPGAGRRRKKGAPAPEEAPPVPAAAKPQLQVGGLAHKPATFHSGETVKSTVTVTNNGPAPQSIKLNLFINDALADAQVATVKPGKAKDVTFKWTAQERNKLNIRGELVPT